ncbi:MAG: hypothetical protein CL949_20415 [Erythrobacter sp.]|jgi:hypothetical protein|nr:hypothetical protein [Erythrobacter sp.]MAM40808.1 hypothetical protein [Erythrobacter sp.]
MSVKDPFEILADEITLIRRQIDHLQRTSLDRKDAEHLNSVVAESLDHMAKLTAGIDRSITSRLNLATERTRITATEAAQGAAEAAIEKSHARSLEAARSLSEAAGEARREAWRYFGGFWVWLASIGATGALLGALVAFWIGGTIAARDFGDHPGIFCGRAGGQVVKQSDGSSYCAVWIRKPDR